MIFRTRTNYPARVPTESGLSFSRVLVKAIDEDGHPYVKDTGNVRHDYDLIQAYLDDTKVTTIVSKYEAGDSSVLAKTQHIYADIVGQATRLQDAQNAMIKVQAAYNRAPVEVRNKYTTLNQFMKALIDDQLKVIVPDKAPVPGSDPVPVHKAEVTPDVDKKSE